MKPEKFKTTFVFLKGITILGMVIAAINAVLSPFISNLILSRKYYFGGFKIGPWEKAIKFPEFWRTSIGNIVFYIALLIIFYQCYGLVKGVVRNKQINKSIERYILRASVCCIICGLALILVSWSSLSVWPIISIFQYPIIFLAYNYVILIRIMCFLLFGALLFVAYLEMRRHLVK